MASPIDTRSPTLAPRTIAVLAPPGDTSQLGQALDGFHFHALESIPTARPPVDALVVHPFANDAERGIARAVAWGLPVVLSCAPGPDVPSAPQGHTETGCVDRVATWTADAYVWRAHHLAVALAWVLGEDRFARTVGPLRLTYLGRAGADYARSMVEPTIGSQYPLPTPGPLVIGRWSQPAATIQFATSVARLHARVRPSARGATVEDLASTNGTWVRGVRAATHELAPGDEIAIAGFLRLRLDGAPQAG